MMSKARVDFPEPDTPTKQVSLLRGISTLIFLRLCSLAPVMVILLVIFVGSVSVILAHYTDISLIRRLLSELIQNEEVNNDRRHV